MADRGTRFTNYSSIHSQDAFVGEYQVMYTPGSSPPIQRRKASSRFAANPRVRDPTQSIIIPTAIPDTSAILPSRGTLRDVHVHYNIPADEKEIVASLRKLQRELDTAMERIITLEQERDTAREELRMLRVSMRKSTSPTKKREQAARVEEELFDISRVEDSPIQASPQKTPKNTASKRVSLNNKTHAKTTEDNACVITPIPADRIPALVNGADKENRQASVAAKPKRNSMRAVIQDTEESIMADPTAASNTSRRRRRTSLDDNMTSAYILPDITVSMNQQQNRQPPARPHISKAAQAVLHDHEPQHILDCEVCQRLTSKRHPAHIKSLDFASTAAAKYDDFTAQVTHMIQELNLEEQTVRPRIAPAHALAHLKKMLRDSYEKAKDGHGKAWEDYDAVPAPMQSKRHMAAADRMSMWAKKMEEARVHLDQLRDVEEGMKENI